MRVELKIVCWANNMQVSVIDCLVFMSTGRLAGFKK